MRGRLPVMAVTTALTQSASVVDIGQDGSAASVEVHGFPSQGFILSTHNHPKAS
jgi:hypothetical protein